MKKIENLIKLIFSNVILYKKRTILSIIGILIATIIVNISIITVNYSTFDNQLDYLDYPVYTGVYYPDYLENPKYDLIDMECLYRYNGTVENNIIPSSKISIHLYGCDDDFLNYPIINENNREALSYTELIDGNKMTDIDVLTGKNIIYIEEGYANYLFKDNPFGREIVVDGITYYVNGLIKTTSASLRYLNSFEKNSEFEITGFVPYTTLNSSYDNKEIEKMYVFKYDKSIDLNSLFSKNSYYSYDLAMNEIKLKRNQTINKLIIIFIASVLSMGALEIIIIIFNLKERNQEIGIKRALGATKDDICFEFMFEIIVIGIISLFLGILISYNIDIIMAILFYNSNFIYASFLSLREILLTTSFLLGMIVVASLIPLIYVSNLNIINVIKGE